MIVFYKERLVILSVPKTGTTALESAFRARADIVVANPPDLKHATIYRYNRFFRPMFDKVCGAEMESVAVIREPVSWLGSWYRYRRRPSVKGHPNATHDVSFEEFVQAYVRGSPPPFAKIGSQSRFIDPRGRGPGVTHLFRYEEPARLHQFLTKRLGAMPELTRQNASPEMTLELSAKAKEKYRRKCAEEFELYEAID
ncbi:MAG: sulfotransferase family 2 domain-containing protein [Rhodobacteraceae bacterium]|nr:sulfotransferase family 2 domain-containing protein [Paracoccaceae bacterium]